MFLFYFVQSHIGINMWDHNLVNMLINEFPQDFLDLEFVFFSLYLL